MALNVAEGIILMWPGTHAAIPAGWKRVTALDNKFIKATANAVDPNVSGGSDTHTHTSPAHTHNADAHRHYGSTYEPENAAEDGGGTNTDNADDNHSHTFDFTNVSAGSLSDAVSYAAGDSKPPFHSMIFIEPDGAPAEPPDGCIALYDASSLPTDWDVCDGNNGTPNLANKYIRGANTGANAGTTGGSLNHSHVIDHTHSAVNHYHVGATARTSGAKLRNEEPGGGPICHNHTHTLTLSNVSEAGSAYTGSAGSADSVEPSFRKLRAIQNNTGSGDRPQFIIAMWLGSLASIPVGWSLCDGTNGTIDMRGYHLKIASSGAEVNNTGGSNTHGHSASNSHTHTAAGTHSHTGTTDSFFAGGNTGAGGQPGVKTHNHRSQSVASINNATSSWQYSTVTGDSVNGEPAYLTVAFVQFYGVPVAEDRPMEIRGQQSDSAERTAWVAGVNPAEQRACETHGQDNGNAERRACISGMIKWDREEKPTAPEWTPEQKVPYGVGT